MDDAKLHSETMLDNLCDAYQVCRDMKDHNAVTTPVLAGIIERHFNCCVRLGYTRMGEMFLSLL